MEREIKSCEYFVMERFPDGPPQEVTPYSTLVGEKRKARRSMPILYTRQDAGLQKGGNEIEIKLWKYTCTNDA